MKKKKILLVLTMISLLVPLNNVNAYFDGENGGETLSAKGCDTASTGWCMWNNKTFGAAEVSLVAYKDGAVTDSYGKIVVWNGSLGSEDQTELSGRGHSVYKVGYWPTSSGSYNDIDSIILEDENTKDLLNKIGKSYDTVKEMVSKKEPYETKALGEGQGLRIIVEPIYKIKANGKNGTTAGDAKLGTLRELNSYLTIPSKESFGSYLYVKVTDVYESVDCNSSSPYTRLANDSGPGCGIGVYAPFDDGDEEPKKCKIMAETGNCDSGYIKDPSFSCIYDKNDRAYFVASNDYCQIVCKDEVKYIYPNSSGIKTAYQGSFMTIGAKQYNYDNLPHAVSLGQVQVKNTKICRSTGTTSISRPGGYMDKGTFQDDISALINGGKSDRFNYSTSMYQDQQEVEKAINLWNGVKGVSSISCTKGDDTDSCKEYKSKSDYQDEYGKMKQSEKFELKQSGIKNVDDYIKSKKDANECKEYKQKYDCSYSNGNNGSLSKTYSEDDYDESKVKEDFEKMAKENYDNKSSSYNTRVDNYRSQIDKWNACETGEIFKTIENNLTTATVLLNYSSTNKNGDVVYSYTNQRLSNSITSSKEETKMFDTSSSKIEEIPSNASAYDASNKSTYNYKYDDNGNKKNLSEIKYGTNIVWWQKTNEVKIDFNEPTSGYRYMNIGKGEYVTTRPSINYIDIGYNVLPISISIIRGPVYDFTLSISSLGNVLNKKFSSYLGTTLNTCKYKIDCEEYIIDPNNPNICKKINQDYCLSSKELPIPCGIIGGDMTIIYRTISLKEGQAFPGIDATGRTPGNNWNDIDTIPYKETKRYKYIYNNRGVKGYDVYKLDPMYEITLTPSIMKEYRKYNRKANSQTGVMINKTSSEIGIMGYSDFDSSMLCSPNRIGEYKCTSALLRGQTSYGSKNVSSGNSSLIVKGCAISEGRAGYNNCGDRSIENNKAWSMNVSS